MQRSIFFNFIFVAIFFTTSLWTRDAQEYHQLWQEYSQSNQFSEAIPIYQQAIREYPNESWFYIYLAHSYRMLKQNEQSIPYYEKAIQLNPNQQNIKENVYYGLIDYANHLGFSRGNWAEASPWYNKAIAVDPSNFIGYNLLANNLRNAGKIEEAILPLTRAYDLNPKGNTSGGYEPNFRVTLHAGLSVAKHRKPWVELAIKSMPNNRLIQSGIYKAIAVDDSINLNLFSKSINNPKLIDFMEGVQFLRQSNLKSANLHFQQASNKQKDPFFDQAIADAFRGRIEHLSYTDQMKSPEQDYAVIYYTNAVTRYFKQNPYHTAIKFIAPLKGRFCSSQTEGGKSFHLGLYGHFSYDLNNCENDATGFPIYSVADGEVVIVVNNNPDQKIGAPVDLKAQANYIQIKHSDGSLSMYIHNQKNSARVKSGDRVRAGQLIANIGNSGVSTGPHLHFMLQNSEGLTLPFTVTSLSGRKINSKTPFQNLNIMKENHEFKTD